MKKKLLFILSLLPVLQSTQAAFSDPNFRLDTDITLVDAVGSLLKPLKEKIGKTFFSKLRYFSRNKEANIKKELLALAKNKQPNPNGLLQKYSGYLNLRLDEEENDAIMIATKNGNERFLELARNYNVNLRLKNKNGYEAASLAIVHGHTGCFKLLLNDCRTDMSWKDKAGRNLIALTAELQQIGCLEVLRDHAKVTEKMKEDAAMYFANKKECAEKLNRLFNKHMISPRVQEKVLQKLTLENHLDALKSLSNQWIDEDILENLLFIFTINKNHKAISVLSSADLINNTMKENVAAKLNV